MMQVVQIATGQVIACWGVPGDLEGGENDLTQTSSLFNMQVPYRRALPTPRVVCCARASHPRRPPPVADADPISPCIISWQAAGSACARSSPRSPTGTRRWPSLSRTCVRTNTDRRPSSPISTPTSRTIRGPGAMVGGNRGTSRLDIQQSHLALCSQPPSNLQYILLSCAKTRKLYSEGGAAVVAFVVWGLL